MATNRRATRRNLPSAKTAGAAGRDRWYQGRHRRQGARPSFQGWSPATGLRATQFLDLKRRRMRLSCGVSMIRTGREWFRGEPLVAAALLAGLLGLWASTPASAEDDKPAPPTPAAAEGDKPAPPTI